MANTAKIQQAIAAHASWKARLRNSIATGKLDTPGIRYQLRSRPHGLRVMQRDTTAVHDQRPGPDLRHLGHYKAPRSATLEVIRGDSHRMAAGD